jgi:hypothetical protein
VSEGGQEIADGYSFSASNDSTAVTTSLRRAILSIRPKTTIAGYSANRMMVEDLTFELYGSASAYYQIVYDGTLGGTPAWTDVNTASSGMQKDVAGTSVTGGTVIYTGYITTAGGASKANIAGIVANKFPLTLNIAGTIPKIISIVVKPVTGSGDYLGAFDWKEVR